MDEKHIEQLEGFAAEQGLTPRQPPQIVVAGTKGGKPELDLSWPLASLGYQLGRLARESDLYRQGESFVTVDRKSGEARLMTCARFCSYAESLCWPYKVRDNRSGEPIKAFQRMGKDLAQLILETDELRTVARELRGVHTVRLPVWRNEGKTIELLPPGYDEETQIFTAETVIFDVHWKPEQAKTWLREILADYPWATEWSAGVHLAAMLSPFVRLLLPKGAKWLMIVYNGNQPGTGKSTLARMALAGVYGAVATQSVTRNPDELRKILDVCAFERKPFLFLDNLGDLRSDELNAFVTSGRWSARVLGKSQSVEVPIEAQVFITGNTLDVGRDLARRAAVCELFLASDACERKFKREITDEWLREPETRPQLLAATWAAVRHWQSLGMPTDEDSRRPSFEAYAKLVGSIVAAFGFGSPFAHAVIAGDEEGEATKALLAAVAAGVDEDEPEKFRTADLLKIAEDLALIDVIVPYSKDQAKALGKKLKPWRGRKLRDSRGRLFEFGRRHGERGAIYEVTILSDESDS